jgi:hypothetical protein
MTGDGTILREGYVKMMKTHHAENAMLAGFRKEIRNNSDRQIIVDSADIRQSSS